ncbi:hypothetical protein OC842_007810 [Tilletia horrida]|uniref:Uncharacterized protein n=1 Tax=Tilletia horrida TaxID=155126 RepID=A0AAN6G356_9BASI|nr:hypothetical protein OC842_007810 [Tilletia horrida]
MARVDGPNVVVNKATRCTTVILVTADQREPVSAAAEAIVKAMVAQLADPNKTITERDRKIRTLTDEARATGLQQAADQATILSLQKALDTEVKKVADATKELTDAYQALSEANGKLAHQAATKKQLVEARSANSKATRRLLDMKVKAAASHKTLDQIHELTGNKKKK